jgi:hypothetical protein
MFTVPAPLAGPLLGFVSDGLERREAQHGTAGVQRVAWTDLLEALKVAAAAVEHRRKSDTGHVSAAGSDIGGGSGRALVTTRDAAVRMNVGQRHALRLLAAAAVRPVSRAGRASLWAPEDVERLVAGR